MAAAKPIIHLVAVAGSCREMLDQLGCSTARQLVDRVRSHVGQAYRVTGNNRLIEAGEDQLHGGRNDDAARARDLQRAMSDDQVAAIVSLRGGSWLTRILPRIDFNVLRRRRTRVALFGFSELTSVINIAATCPKAVCWYDMGPAFLPAGLRRWVLTKGTHALPPETDSRTWAQAQFPARLAEFFADVVSMIEGRGSNRQIQGRLVRGHLAPSQPIKICGGAISVLNTLIGTPYARRVFRPGLWLALEDVNESPYRIDRALAHLSIAGMFDRCAGLLIGDFHEREHDRVEQALHSLNRMLPHGSRLPVVVSADFGHVWPMSPLPVGRPVQLHCRSRTVRLDVPWHKLASVSKNSPAE